MASKATLVNGEERQTPVKRREANSAPNMFDKIVGVWNDFTRFLTDVRAEMRKVVAPSRKEVEVTTWVVLVTVFLFGLFFFVVDAVFRYGINHLIEKLGASQ